MFDHSCGWKLKCSFVHIGSHSDSFIVSVTITHRKNYTLMAAALLIHMSLGTGINYIQLETAC